MTSTTGLHGPPTESRTRRWVRTFAPFGWAVSLSAVITGPWFGPGFIFGTDGPGPTHFTLPNELSSSAPISATLAMASFAIGAEVTGKALVIGSLLAAAILSYRCLPNRGFVASAAASAVYVVN